MPKRSWRAVLSVLFVTVPGCGGGSTHTPVTPSTPSPTQPPPAIIAQGAGIPVCDECGEWIYFSPPSAGSVTVTADYTFPDSVIGIWMSPGHCTYEMSEADQCNWIVRSFTTDKPKKVAQAVSATEYTLVIDNRGPHDEAVSFQVVLNALASSDRSRLSEAATAPAGPHPPLGR